MYMCMLLLCSLRLRGVFWVTMTTGICQTCQTKRKSLAKLSNLKLLTSYYTWKLMFPRYTFPWKANMPWAALSIWGPPASPFLHTYHLVPFSDTGQPLFPHPFFPRGDKKAAISSSNLKSQSHWIMPFKSIRALKLCYISAGEAFKLWNTFRAAAIRWKEFGTESLMLPCFPTVRNGGTQLTFRAIEEKSSWH